MGTWTRGRWLSTLFVAAVPVIAAASCGGAGNSGPAVLPDASTTPEDGGPSVFVSSDAGTMTCVPKTCAQLGYTCGMNGDGCGSPLDCGSCRRSEERRVGKECRSRGG